ncbi:coproporphyrinogen III oxidase [Clostridia bacterium]|nr:coproporphyrinogen III oxidase [Clostridia bacterium]
MTLIGHDFLYDAEQSLLTYFPGDKPQVTSVLRGRTCETTIGSVRAAARAPDLDVRNLRHCVKLSFYRAAKLYTGLSYPWGSLTGVRPAKMLGLVSPEVLRKRYDVSAKRVRLCQSAYNAAQAAKATLSPGDTALYISIPFCPTRCAYCSFISHDVKNAAKLMQPYVSALERELDSLKPMSPVAIYIGGGTPTALSDDLLERVLKKVNEFDLSKLREYTVEAGRPDTFTPDNMRLLRDYGAGRISVNPQSMNPEALAAIGRRHSPEATISAFELARGAGFQAINTDVIAGLPADDLRGFKSTLDTIIGLRPENITVHTLSLKRGAALTDNANTDTAAMVDYSQQTLPKYGYKPYYLYRQKSAAFENVGWTLDGHECLYNLIMMEELADVAGAGAGAACKTITDGRTNRRFNPKYPAEYNERWC